jgi:hypothetical protein
MEPSGTLSVAGQDLQEKDETMRKLILSAVLAAIAIPTAPAVADNHWKHRRHGMYDSHGRYYEPQRLSRNDRVWRGRDGRYYCKRGNGTTGLIVGAAAGALLGRAIDTRGDRLLGTLLGGAGGAALGREIDRGGVRCR